MILIRAKWLFKIMTLLICASILPKANARLTIEVPQKLSNDKFKIDSIPANFPQAKKYAGIYGEDNRYISDGKTYPFSTIGLMVGEEGAVCTATLISQCHIMTASHCFTGRGTMLKDELTEIFISSDNTESARVNARYAYETNILGKKYDWAIARLDENLGDTFGNMGVINASGDSLKGDLWNWLGWSPYTKYTIAGYSSDLMKLTEDWAPPLSVDDQVEIYGNHWNIINFRADTFSGSSGASIWRFSDEKKPYIVGVNTRAHMAYNVEIKDGKIEEIRKQLYFPQNESNSLGVGVATAQFFDEMVQFMKDYPCQQ